MAKTLEIEIYGMMSDGDGGYTGANFRGEVEFWDVVLLERDDETGEGNPIEEHEFLTEEKAFEVTEDIAKRYPHAIENERYPY